MSQFPTATERPTPRPASPAGARRPDRRWWILAVIAVAQLMVVLDATIVNIALPSAQEDLDFSNGDRQWIVTSYALAFGSLLLLGGRIADLFGRKVTFLTGLTGFAAASALGGAAPTFEVLVTARALQGVFGALLAPAALSLLTTTFTDARERAKAFSVYGAVAGAGGAIGLLLGGVLTEQLTWRWTLYVNLVFALAAFAGGALLLARTARDRGATLDIPGTVLVSAGLFGLVYGFSNAETHDWDHPATWGWLLAGTALLAAFVGWQTRAAHPLLPMRVLLDRDRGASHAAVLLSGVGLFGVFLFLTYYLQGSLAYSPIETGLAFLPMIGALMLSATVLATSLLPRVGPRPLVSAGMGLAAAGLAWLTGLGLDSGYAADVMPPTIVAGLGIGLVIAPAMNLATAGIAPEDAGVASATVNTMQQIGGSIGTAVLNTLAASAARDHLASGDPTDPAVQAQAALESYATAYWWSAGFFAAGLVVSFALYRRGVPRAALQDGPGAVHL
ncbi:MFS transporter [Streptomyces sp. SBT349]|uniref:MFS transporter n=1 Tax=Streptomyces sp. SBT349 TaxID=1580539 RepID=UPI00066A7F34|nr:MFS transporter [Streptomyces sp. SBT349]